MKFHTAYISCGLVNYLVASNLYKNADGV